MNGIAGGLKRLLKREPDRLGKKNPYKFWMPTTMEFSTKGI